MGASRWDNQRWKLIDKGNGIYELEPQHAIGKRLDVEGSSTSDGAKVQTYWSHGDPNQRWKLIPGETACMNWNLSAPSQASGYRSGGEHQPGHQQVGYASASQQWKLVLVSNTTATRWPRREQTKPYPAIPIHLMYRPTHSLSGNPRKAGKLSSRFITAGRVMGRILM
jgi:hypothetical protein